MTKQPEAVTPNPATDPASGIAEWLSAHTDVNVSDLEHLLMARLHINRTALLLHPEQRIDAAMLIQLNADVARLRDAEPLGYVLGEQPFRDLNLMVDQRVLVPRPETELLIDAVLSHCKEPGQRCRSILDLGTGSGAIAIALAAALGPATAVTAVDQSPAALEVARHNANTAQVTVDFTHSHWFTRIRGRFDVIVSNPPYIAELDPHIPALRHEPPEALLAGTAGLRDLRHIIANAGRHLQPAGALFVEHGSDQGNAVRTLFSSAGFADVHTIADYGEHQRFCCGRLESMT